MNNDVRRMTTCITIASDSAPVVYNSSASTPARPVQWADFAIKCSNYFKKFSNCLNNVRINNNVESVDNLYENAINSVH